MLCRSACSCTPSNSTGERLSAIAAASMPNNVITIIGPLTDIHQMGKQLNYIPMRGNRTPGSLVHDNVYYIGETIHS